MQDVEDFILDMYAEGHVNGPETIQLIRKLRNAAGSEFTLRYVMDRMKSANARKALEK